MKALVAYFSPTGITKGKAMELAADIGGDLFGIRPVQAYSAADLDWTNPHSRSSMEMKGNSSVLPEPAETVDLHEYDTLFVGYPIWWNRAPRIIDLDRLPSSVNGLSRINSA
ncbi:flavodoxin, partial [Faecalibaculum rodentium]|uniref:flavodoxin n=1 Tax=Faecalibaculum rodentium TaxID=1702221 RepID=UPI00248B523C